MSFNPQTNTANVTKGFLETELKKYSSKAYTTGVVAPIQNELNNITSEITVTPNNVTVDANINVPVPFIINGSVATCITIPSLSGDVTNVGNNVSLLNSAVVGKVLTGFTSGSGSVGVTDSLISALQKVDANINNEVSARQSAITAVSTSLTNEITNRTIADTTISSNLTTETSRATTAENAITSALNTYKTANLAGIQTNNLESTSSSLNIACSNASNTLNVGCGTGLQVLNIGTGIGATTINVGGAGDTVAIAGTLVTVSSTNLDVADKNITVNKGGLSGSAYGAGLNFEEGGVATGYIVVSGDRNAILMKAPNNPALLCINQSLKTTDSPIFANLSGINTGDQINITGNAGTVTNGVYTTSIGTVTNTMLAGSIASSKLLNTAVQNLSGINTGDQTNITGNAGTVTTIPALFGEVTSSGLSNSVTLNNSSVTGKLLTGLTGTFTTINATDTILGALSKTSDILNNATSANIPYSLVQRDSNSNFTANNITASLTGNSTSCITIPTLTGEVSTIANSVTLSNSAVTGKVLTGLSSTVFSNIVASDTLLLAIGKTANLLNNATTLNTINQLVKRDANGTIRCTELIGNLTGGVTGNVNGNASTSTVSATCSTIPTLNGEISNVGNTMTLVNNSVINKILSTFVTVLPGTSVTTSDSIVSSIQKLAANNTVNAAMLGEATSNGINNTVTLTNASVINKTLTGYVSTPGIITSTDTILSGIQKLNGNVSSLGTVDVLATPNTIVYRDANADTGIRDVKIRRLRSTAKNTIILDCDTGFSAFDSNTNIGEGGNQTSTGYGNISIGKLAGVSLTNPIHNIAIGYNTLSSCTTGANNISLGYRANTQNVTGATNLAIGTSSLFNNTVSNNVAVGSGSLQSNTIGALNTALGVNSLLNATTGSSNVGIGYMAGVGDGVSNMHTTGSNCTYLGYQTGTMAVTNLSNITAIGSGCLGLFSNTVQLGNSAVTQVRSNGCYVSGSFSPGLTAGLTIGYDRIVGSSSSVFANRTNLITANSGFEWVNYDNQNVLTSVNPLMYLDISGNLKTGGNLVLNAGNDLITFTQTLNGQWTGPFTVNNSIRMTRRGNVVTILMQSITSTTSTVSVIANYSVVIPAIYRPSTFYGPYFSGRSSILNNTVNNLYSGQIDISTLTGSMTLSIVGTKITGGVFTSGIDYLWSGTSFSYEVA